ncbi:App1 family protein [Methylobacterium persicinum]|uniref:Phosphatidate phosphatase APP1 n=1 Tax=Methylobacterium persicinum TaxID=374426 RepID=A0ABU0HIK0_9HYPH|nr:phosphatase domain-containing protein [Methylobacterium persicinum]MDQ0442140.1 phosphatidate phosphatase APP1 [Methylobacterium persicinum]
MPIRAVTAARKALRVVARPVRRAQGRGGRGPGGLVVEPYRGYGSPDEIFLIGRVFRQSAGIPGEDPESLRAQWRDVRRRIARRKVAGAAILARFGGAETRVLTDRDGYFRVHLHPQSLPEGDGPWHVVDLLLEADPVIPAQGSVYIPPRESGFVVVSDIDDTVMRTGVANKLKMLWRLFVEDAASRVAFPGAAALYRALHVGASGHAGNPMLYVSRAPWGLYEMLTEFFRRHGIPAGPVLFLREWGLSWTHPLPRRAKDHKRALIDHMLALYPALPFVLIGDSGQHDPEVYAQLVAENPGRVKAVYIRNVSRNAARSEEIVKLAEAVAATGSSLVLAADSVAIARHAAGLGLIRDEAVAAVADEHAGSDAPAPFADTVHLSPPPGPIGEAAETVLAPDVIAAISAEGPVPPTVVVTPRVEADQASVTRV